MSRASSGPAMTRARMPVSRSMRARNSPPLRASRVGAGRGGENLVDAVRLGEAFELGQRLERRGHRLGGQRAAVEAAGAEPDHRLFAVDDLEREVRADPDHDHVDGIGADVDRCDAHEVRKTRELIFGWDGRKINVRLNMERTSSSELLIRQRLAALTRTLPRPSRAMCARSTRRASPRAGCAKRCRSWRRARAGASSSVSCDA